MAGLEMLSATKLLETLAARDVSSRELLDHFAARVDRLNPQLNAVVTLDLERARRVADAADQARARGDSLGPLHGLPITIKDTFETEGLRSTAGVPELGNHVPGADAIAVARLRAAGAVIFGKTNTPTWAGDWQSYNPIFGRTNNPWDLERTPGGSSGGAAAAVAAGLTAFELGSDIGGSVRVPAHCCGIFGHKPSHGIVPQRGHLPGRPGDRHEADLNSIGPLARSVDDLELVLDVIAGPPPDRAVAWSLALPPARKTSLESYRVAVWFDEPSCPIDSEMRGLLEQAAVALEREGVKIDRQARPEVDFVDAIRTYLDLLSSLEGRVRDDDEMAKAEANGWGIAIRHRDWLQADERRQEIRERWAAFFGDRDRNFDILLCPVTLCPAIPHDTETRFDLRTIRIDGRDRTYGDQIYWPGLITGPLLPSTVIPVGRTAANLPVGVQIVAPFLQDRTGLDFARRASEVLGGFTAPAGF